MEVDELDHKQRTVEKETSINYSKTDKQEKDKDDKERNPTKPQKVLVKHSRTTLGNIKPRSFNMKKLEPASLKKASSKFPENRETLSPENIPTELEGCEESYFDTIRREKNEMDQVFIPYSFIEN